MKEFIEKLIGRLEELGWLEDTPLDTIIEEFAEEYKDDGCEWFKYDYRTIAPKHHNNIWSISENLYWRYGGKDAHIKYCPYCGKEIKVME